MGCKNKLKMLMKFFHRLYNFLLRNKNKQDQIGIYFHKLTPSDNVDISIYTEAIDFVFTDDDIKNVAISGSYGAGKSSVLET